ncbi:sugar phosphate isomerase/epimerase family protein [Thermanaeromonas sp. C210]|uniref:sugar phosphate isomerase/epimerase family protein n=1 Tax=Thermanaeromonas sp. C210 TaxID=2731925 RepID=UPI00155CC650|nr:sugar phosphate isomerase/epimerase family protein [Thermanaeromonas sp. C210]GFN22582.1 epimerase [Thermanaeromonas sp. C210]
MGFKYSISNWIYGDEALETTFQRLKRYGYDGVELMGEPARYDTDEVEALCKQYGLKVLSIAGMYPWPTEERDLSNPREEVRRRAVQYLKDCCDFAVRLEAGVIIVVPSAVGKVLPVGEPRDEEEWLKAYDKEWKLAVESLGEAALYAEKQGVVLAIEPINRYETFLVNTCEQGLRMIQEIGSPAVKLHLDVFHMNIEERDVAQAIRAAKGVLVNLHVADSNRTAVGEGHIDFKAVLQALLDIGYEGMLSLEPLPPVPDPYMAARMKRFMHLWDDYARISIERLKDIEGELRGGESRG